MGIATRVLKLLKSNANLFSLLRCAIYVCSGPLIPYESSLSSFYVGYDIKGLAEVKDYNVNSSVG